MKYFYKLLTCMLMISSFIPTITYAEKADKEYIDNGDRLVREYSDNGDKRVREYSDNGDKRVREYSDNGDRLVREYSDNGDKRVREYSDNGDKRVREYSDNGDRLVREYSDNGDKRVREYSDNGDKNIMKYIDRKIDKNDRRYKELETKIDRQDKRINRGLASASAISGLFQPYNVGKFNMTAGIGGYRGESSIAVGAGYRFNEKFAMKVGVASSVHEESSAMYNASMNFEW